MTRPYDNRAKWAEREKANRDKQKEKKSKKMADNSGSDFTYSFQIDGGSFFSAATAQPKPKAVPLPVLWDDIVGQVEAKAAVREAIEGATKHAELYKRYGRRPTRGILLYGPPGNGKTMLGKAAASAIAAQYGQPARESGFIYVKGPEILTKWLGESEQKIRQFFQRARAHKQAHGYPAIIFIDEAESILDHRRQSSMSATIVPAFLAEMDGMEETGAIVILATNRPGSLDSAVIREGRIDRKIMVGRPSREDAVALIAKCLTGRPVEGGELALEAAAVLFDSRHTLYRLQLREGQSKVVTFGCFTNGAQIAYLVDAAASFAIDREISTGEPGAIRLDDFRAAIARTLKEQRELDHSTELAAFCEPFIGDVVGLERVRGDGIVAKRSLIARMPEGMEVVVTGTPMAATVPQC